nr:MAG TPA: Protein of unknown function (DUF722) [Caudoviricetes sp.]
MSGIGAAGQANLVNVWETHYKTDLRQVNDLDKEILVQYCEMREEIKDIRRRIGELDKYLEHPPIVSDTVKGTRKDGTYGPIKITGIPDPQYQRKGAARERLREMLTAKEEELLELTCQAEKYIENIDKSEVRIMFRLYYIDGLPWWKVAQAMNRMLPRRRVKFTEDSCRMRNNRFFEEI